MLYFSRARNLNHYDLRRQPLLRVIEVWDDIADLKFRQYMFESLVKFVTNTAPSNTFYTGTLKVLVKSHINNLFLTIQHIKTRIYLGER